MDGKFTNTEIVNSLDVIMDSFKDRLANPFYNFNSEKGTTVTYYNVDLNNYPLDDATGLQHSPIGSETNTKYNKIENFIIYGLDKIMITLENTDDMGTEAEEITGEAIILPNTIRPYPGDYFTVNHLKEKVLFKVIDSQSDTFENGGNVYEIKYKLSATSDEKINEFNVGVESQFILNNVGTQYNSVIENSIYRVIDKLDTVSSSMREYYKSVFYDDRVQSLIFTANGKRFYDSFLTEFIIRNEILSERKGYIYIQHQLNLPKTFALDYSRTFFSCIDKKTKDRLHNITTVAFGELIESKVNVFSTRYEPYLAMNYRTDTMNLADSFAPGLIYEVFDKVLISNIENEQYFGDDILSDLIIKYFNDDTPTLEDVEALDIINYSDNAMLFYYVPVAIYIMEYYIKKLMLKQANN